MSEPGIPEVVGASARPVEVRVGRLLGVLLTILAGAGVVWLVAQLLAPASHVLVLVVFGSILMFILRPVVNRLAQRGMPRGLAATTAMLAFIAGTLAVLVVLLGPLTEQLAGLASQAPATVDAAKRAILGVERFAIGQGASADWIAAQEGVITDQLGQLVQAVLGFAINFLTGLVGSVFDALLVLTFSAYLLADGPHFRDSIMRLVPARWRPAGFFVQETIVTSIGGYIIAQLSIGLFVGLTIGVSCWLLGLPYPVVIGLLAGLLEMIPVVGPYLSAVPAILVALPLGMPTILWVIIVLVVIQQFVLNILGPRVTGQAVGLHPFVALIVILTGASIAGLIGALAAVPIAASAYVLTSRAYWSWQAARRPVVLSDRLARLDDRAEAACLAFETAELARAPVVPSAT